jgi:hypothetical protein
LQEYCALRFLTGDDRSIYVVTFGGALLWYRDLLRDGTNGLDAERGWDPNSGNQIGVGWNGFEHVFAGGGGTIYAILPSGELLWYRDLLRDGSNGLRGELGWAPNSGKQINAGWNGFKHVFCGGDGRIYAIRQTGELLWYRDQLGDGSNGPNGERGWDPNSASQIGVGWNAFEHVFSGDNGIIYTIGNAELNWYQDLLRDGSNGANGETGWAYSSDVIGDAWGAIQHVFSAGGGVIYGIEDRDLFFSLDQRRDGGKGSSVEPGDRIGLERRFTIGSATFLMVRGADNLHVGLDWWSFRLEPGTEAPAGRARLVAQSDEATVTLTFPPQILSEPAMMPGDRLPLQTKRSLPSAVQFSVPAGTAIELNPESVLTVLANAATVVPTGPSGELTTQLEIPWHLLVTVAPQSDGQAAEADHVAVPITSPAGITGLWHTRLTASDGDDTDARLWLVPIGGMSDDIDTPLKSDDRATILQETASGQGFPHLRRLELSALGGSLSVSARWPDFEWDQDVVMGRDQRVRTLMIGALYPFGHRAVVTNITERGFPADPPPAPSIAALTSTSTLLILEPIRALLARDFPFDEVEILGRSFTPDPAPDHVFVPNVNGQPLRFPVRCAGAQGDVLFQTPLVFVAAGPGDPNPATLWEQFSQIELPGIPIDVVHGAVLADAVSSPQPSAGDVHEVHAITIDSVPDGGAFLPKLSTFTATLPALRALMCETAAEAAAKAESVVLTYTDQFRNQPGIPDLALKLVNPVNVNFTDRPDRSGGLMAPKFDADTISRTLGLVPSGALTGAPLSDIYKGAKLLGLPLDDVLDAAAQPGAPTIVPLTNPAGAKMSWENLHLKAPDNSPLKTNPSTTATLTVEKSADKSEVTCTVENFSLVIPPTKALVTLTFGALTFTQTGGHAPDLKIDGLGIAFENELALIQPLLATLLKLMGVATPMAHGAPADPTAASGPAGFTITTTPAGLTAGFSAGIDKVPGPFLMRNIAAHFGVDIPFSTNPVTVSLGFASRDNPFNLSVLMFGGGGYVDAQLGGVTMIEASMDFGAVVAVDFIVAAGEVHALGGVHFLKQGDDVVLDAFIRLGGSVEVLGVVSVSVELVVTLQYQSNGNQLEGHATLVIDVDVTLFSESVTIDSGNWVLGGSQGAFSPMHRASFDDGLADLLKYYEAFAT